MIFGIYQCLIIHIIFVVHGVESLSIEIKVNVSGVLGENGTELECSYARETVRSITRIDIMAFNRSKVEFEQIAAYLPDDISTLLPQGQYLKGRVTLTRITQSSTNAIMLFNKLMCIDGTFYKCKVTYTDDSLLSHTDTSDNTSMQVKVKPSKPDNIVLMTVSAVSSSTTPTVPMSTTTSLSSSTETISTMDIDEQNDPTAATQTTLHITDHNTTSSTPLVDHLFTDSSYRTTTQYLQQTTTAALGISEGDNITVVCSGYVGKPPAEYIFQKYRNDNILSMNYTATETFISEIFENCSYYRTSNLTFQVTAEDNNAVIRCVVNSSMYESDMFVDTEPIPVYYEVSMPTITKYPNDSYYIVDEATSINLTCKSDGNPTPNYQWYKENNNEPVSTSANWTITDINVTNSGLYTCNVSNTFNGNTHRNAKHVQINIMNKAYTTRVTLEHSSTLDDVPTTQPSSTCSSSCVEKKEGKSKGNLDDIPTTQSSSNCRSTCVDKKEEKPKENLGLVVGIVVSVVTVFVVIIVIIAYRRRKRESPTFKNVSNSFDDSKPKPVTQPRTGDYDYIALEDDPPKPKGSNNGLEVEDITKHNAEYLKKEEEEKKKNESNTPPQPAVYAQVNEASKLRNKQKTDAVDSNGKQDEDTYAETQEGIYDKAGDRRHKEKDNDEHYDSSFNSSTQNSNGDSKLAIQTSQVGSYANQGFEKDDNRKVATVSPTVRSSSGFQNDEQPNSNRNSQSKKGNENIIGAEQTGISENDSSHRTAL